MGKRSDVSTTDRQEAVLALLRREDSAEAVARRYEVSTTTLYAWRDTFLAGAQAALANGNGKGGAQTRRIEELEKDLAERDRVIGELTIVNRILKKTAERRSSTT